MKRFLAGLAVAALAGTCPADGFDHAAYKASSLPQAIADQGLPDTDLMIEAANVKYKVSVRYTGNHRNTAAPVQELIRAWVKALRHPKEYAAYFDHEVEVEVEGKRYWLPIQDPLVEPFAAEVPGGGSVTLYIMLLGSYKQTYVFCINEFEAHVVQQGAPADGPRPAGSGSPRYARRG